jgi:hypothetical protein
MLTLALHGLYFRLERFQFFARPGENRFLHLEFFSRHEIQLAQQFLNRLITHTGLIPEARLKRQWHMAVLSAVCPLNSPVWPTGIDMIMGVTDLS